jgi:hypothetical protein
LGGVVGIPKVNLVRAAVGAPAWPDLSHMVAPRMKAISTIAIRLSIAILLRRVMLAKN